MKPVSHCAGTFWVTSAGLVLLSIGSLTAAQDFRITSVQVTNSDVRIVWNAAGGSNYVVQAAAFLSGGTTNFTDVSQIIPIPGVGLRSTSYTHVGGLLVNASRYYRVRSYAFPPQLQILPTNAIIGVGMTTRYKVFLVYSDNSRQDVSTNATLTVLNNIGQTAGVASGFALVRGTSFGTGSVRAVYQGITNTAPLNVSQLTGLYTDPPLSRIRDYVNGTSYPVQVMGIFSNGETNNITPSSNLEAYGGGPPPGTRVDYNIQANVANSYALITGQSAAASSLVFTVGEESTPYFDVNWCWFTGVSLQPQDALLIPGQVQPFAVIGHLADGSDVNVLNYIFPFQITFTSDDDSVAQADSATFLVTAAAPGTTTIRASAYNGPGFFCAGGLDGDTTVTVAPASPAVTLWTNSYNGPANNFDGANALALDKGGNPSVTGSSVGSGSDYDYATVRYSSAGVPLWTNRYNGPGNTTDTAVAITTDASSNVVVTGYTTTAGLHDWATIKYSASGTPLWTNQYNGPAGLNDEPTGVVVDTNGNVFVTGQAATATVSDFATIKYNAAGAPAWINFYDGPGKGNDRAVAIAIDTNGSVFVTGYSAGSGGNSDFATIKYSNLGLPLWTNRFNGSANANDYPSALTVDNSGNLIVVGRSAESGSGSDFTTIKYSNSGTPVWTNHYSGPGAYTDQPAAIAADGNGNVLVTGYSTASDGHIYWATIKYTASGMPLWTNLFRGNINGNNSQATGIAVDGSGNVVVTGYAYSLIYPDFVTIKYSSTGAILWVATYGNGLGRAVATAPNGNVFVTGTGPDSNGYGNYLTVKCAP